MSRTLFFILVLLLFISNRLHAQNTSSISQEHGSQTPSEAGKSFKPYKEPKTIRANHRGLNWSIGFGLGQSSHASAYTINRDFDVKNFSGFRAIVLDTKIGFGLHENIVLFGTWKYAPGNAIISPYRSNYFGGALAYHFYRFSIHGGLGTYNAKLDKNEIAGKGLLMDLGLLIQLGPNFGCELTVLSGKMEPGTVDAYLSESTELNFSLGLAYVF
ncbi:MAG: hypothetical protein AB8G86_18340 [Saprospiraceae bacterium]